MVRYGLSIAVLLAVIVWLVLSYMPGAAALLPAIAFDDAWAARVLPLLAGLTFAGFVVIQAVVLAGTGRMMRHPPTSALAATVQQFQLRYGREMFWTALPLVMTVVLAATLYVIGV
jgi:hypothetical protein